MPLLTGAFTSSGELSSTGGIVPATAQISLQQGTTSSGATLDLDQNVTGSITLTGSSCISSGTIAAANGFLFGTAVQAEFTMNDGSKMMLLGEISATDASQFRASLLTVSSGSCNLGTGFIPVNDYPVTFNTFTKQ
jgi:hypothetical protein